MTQRKPLGSHETNSTHHHWLKVSLPLTWSHLRLVFPFLIFYMLSGVCPLRGHLQLCSFNGLVTSRHWLLMALRVAVRSDFAGKCDRPATGLQWVMASVEPSCLPAWGQRGQGAVQRLDSIRGYDLGTARLASPFLIWTLCLLIF